MAVMCDEIGEVLTRRHSVQNLEKITGSRANIIWDQKNGTQMAEWMRERVACWTDTPNPYTSTTTTTTTTTASELQAFDTYKVACVGPTHDNSDTAIMAAAFALAGVFCVTIIVLAMFATRRMRPKRKLSTNSDAHLFYNR